MSAALFTLAGWPTSVGVAIAAGAICLLLICLVLLWRARRAGRRAEAEAAAHAAELEGQLGRRI